MKRSRVQLVVGLVALAVAGCGRGERGETVDVRVGALGAATQRITIALPQGAGFDAVPVAADGELRVSDRARVQVPGGTPSGAVANSGTTLTDLGVDSKVGTTTSAAAVTLRDRAQVTGDVLSSQSVTRGSATIVTGVVQQNTPLTFDRWSWSISLPASGGPVSVPVNGSRSIAPGAYAGVQAFSGATLSLVAGTYYMDALTMEPQSRLAVDTRNGNVIVYLRAGFTFRGSTVYTGPNDRLLLVYLGTAEPALDRSFDGTFVAPNASVRLGVGGSPYTGAVYAKSVSIDPDVRLTARRFAGWGQMPFAVEPRFNCVERRPGGAFVGQFGYRNPGPATVNIPIGANNRFSPGLENRQQPTAFLPGTHDNQFAITWVTHEASWFVNGVEARVDPAKVCPSSTSFAGNADTTVNAGADHANFGTATTLEVGAGRHTLVSFDRAAIAAFLGANRLIRAARLELTVSGAPPTTPVEVIAMRKGWTESGATWTCSNDTDASAANESCAQPARWKMVRRDGVWENPWYRVVPGASSVGVVSSGKLVFDVTAETQQFLGTERTERAVSFILQAGGATGLSGTFRSREAGTAVAPTLVIEPISFTDFDVVSADDQHAPFSITVDSMVVPTRAPMPALVQGGAPRPVAAVRAADGTLAEFTDGELLVLTDSASELASIQARLGATLLYQSPFTIPNMPRLNVIRINPSAVNPAGLASGLVAKVPGLRGRQRASSDAAIRLLAAALDENGRGSKVAPNILMNPTGVDLSALSTGLMTDGVSSVASDPICPGATDGVCSSNPLEWAHLGPGMHNVAKAWKVFAQTGRFLDNIDVGIMDSGFRLDKLDGMGQPPTPGCPGASCPNPFACGGAPCPWHGTDVANAAFGEPDNRYGGAGPGWPALMQSVSLIHTYYEPASYIITGFGSVVSGTDILSMSWRSVIPDWLYPLAHPLETQTEQFRLTGILQFAAAGNEPISIDRKRCYEIVEPITDTIAGVFGGNTPLRTTVCPWEESFTFPCESWGVNCVEGTNFANKSRHPRSAFGDTQYAASFVTRNAGVDTADDSKHYSVAGTSISTPIVAGIAALTWAANPALSSWDVEACLGRGGKFVDAFASVSCAVGSPGNFAPLVAITSPEDRKEVPSLTPPATIARLNAWADDVEDGRLNVINWTVNGAPIGSTMSNQDLNFSIPGPGTYVAEATAQDSAGLVGRTTVTFYVNPPVPDIVIVTPPKLPNVLGERFAAYVGVPIDLRAIIPNRPQAPCSAVRWSAFKGTIPVFTDKPGCVLQEAFDSPQVPASVELRATYSDAFGSDTDTVIIDLMDDGFARIVITQPAATGFDGLIRVHVDEPTTLNATARRIPAGNPFTWTYQTGDSPLQVIGGSTPSTTVTFTNPLATCNGVPGTINVIAFDSFGTPIRDDVSVLFDKPSLCIVK